MVHVDLNLVIALPVQLKLYSALPSSICINSNYLMLIMYFILVMILGVLIAKKKYPAAKYLFVLMIVAGVALFLYKDVSRIKDEFKYHIYKCVL